MANTFGVVRSTVLAPGGDVDGDGVIDPGDTVRTSVTITNQGSGTATGTSFTDTQTRRRA